MMQFRMHHSGAALEALISRAKSPQCRASVHINRLFLPIKAAYFLQFAAYVSLLPYLPIYMTYLGLTPTQVGILTTMGPFTYLITGPLVGIIVDRFAIHKLVLLLSVIIPGITYSAMYFVPHVEETAPWIPLSTQNVTEIPYVVKEMPLTTQNSTEMRYGEETVAWNPSGTQSLHFAEKIRSRTHTLLKTALQTTPKPTTNNSFMTFWILMAIIIVCRTFNGQFDTIMDSSTQKLTEQHGAEFGRQRLWGAVAWGMWSPIAGAAIDAFQPTQTLSNKYTPIFCMFATLVVLCIGPVLLIQIPTHEQPQSVSRNLVSLFLQPIFIMFIITIFVCGAILGIVSNYLFIFLQEEMNSPHYLMGLTLTVTCIAEVPVMFFAKKIIAAMGHMNAMNLVLFTWGIRSLLYSVLRSPFWVLPIELLHGITFGLFYTAFTAFINWISPEGVQTSVQALCRGIFFGLGFGSGMLCGGFVYDTYGGRNLFRASAVMCIATFALMVICQCILRGRTHREQSAEYEAI